MAPRVLLLAIKDVHAHTTYRGRPAIASGAEMLAALPDAELVVVPDAGHTVHLERPDAFAAALSSFLQERESAVRLA
jgi:pimeloyl-ACP methyl ester carboxylesterase